MLRDDLFVTEFRRISVYETLDRLRNFNSAGTAERQLCSSGQLRRSALTERDQNLAVRFARMDGVSDRDRR